MSGMSRKALYLIAVLIGGKGAASHDADDDRRLKGSEYATHHWRMLRKEDVSQPPLLKIQKEDESRDDEPLPDEATKNSSSVLVDYLYTYGAPSISNPAISNPGNRCVPGIRAYTENISSGKVCSWWDFWCSSNEHITNTDNIAQVNADRAPHVKMSTLVLRLRDGTAAEYIWKECKDSEEVGQYDFQSWPVSSQPAGLEIGILGIDDDIHHLHTHYVPRLIEVPESIRGPMVEYASVLKCTFNKEKKKEIKDCLESYGDDFDGLPGLDPEKWETIALMHRVTKPSGLGSAIGLAKDKDSVYVLKNDEDPARRRCVVTFEAVNNNADTLRYYETHELSLYRDYCGSGGVQVGLRNELSDLTHDPEYEKEIRPALETCREVTCVGNSHGAALCSVFTMCANNGLENIRAAEALAASSDGSTVVNEDMYDDYYSLAWNKK